VSATAIPEVLALATSIQTPCGARPCLISSANLCERCILPGRAYEVVSAVLAIQRARVAAWGRSRISCVSKSPANSLPVNGLKIRSISASIPAIHHCCKSRKQSLPENLMRGTFSRQDCLARQRNDPLEQGTCRPFRRKRNDATTEARHARGCLLDFGRIDIFAFVEF